MKGLVRQGLEQGAVGLSTGLTYAPGMYAEDDELVELCRVVAEAGGFYTPHHRNYGSPGGRASGSITRTPTSGSRPTGAAHPSSSP